MTTDTTYNGWSNYETWVIKLWLDNDQGSYEYMQEMAEQYSKGDADSRTGELANAIESMIQEGAPETTGLYADLLNASLNRADYYEIAEAYLSDYFADNPEPIDNADTDDEE